MAIQVLRYEHHGEILWGVHKDGGIAALPERYSTTREFFEAGGEKAAAAATGFTLSLGDVRLLSPVTSDSDYICLGMNYASHLREVGRKTEEAIDNVFFMKASSSICAAHDDIVRPSHVQVLDYENELGFVVGRALDGSEVITGDNWHQWLRAMVITNDVSAREQQVSAEQFHKAKSWRTFGPTGPFLVLPTPDEMHRWQELELVTRVNGEERQRAFAADMIFGPEPTLRELASMRDLAPGDLIATGTPGGVAMQVPGPFVQAVAGFLSKARRLQMFLKAQANNDRVLKPGDEIELSIATRDGALDLGVQRNRIVSVESTG